jgi:Raf kinase inhibitor-like YbhB/YbcL family protein
MALTLMSPAFANGAPIPIRYTCAGAGVSPPLQWSDAPDETQSFLVVCDDPDAPGTFYYWVAYDIPASWQGLKEGYGAETLTNGFKQAINDFGMPGYGGPCPPAGEHKHVYHFRVSALSTNILPAGPGARCQEVIALARPYEIAFAELAGLYQRTKRDVRRSR